MKNCILTVVLIQYSIHFSYSVMLDLPLDGKCEDNWICSREEHCTTIYPLNVSKPNICSFINGNEPVYCCPHLQNFTHKINSKCSQMTRNYCKPLRKKRGLDLIYQPLNPAGNNWAVEGGFQANPRIHTHMALVGYGKVLDDVIWSCAGTIISPNFILSAAHCAFDTDRKKASWVKVGDLDVSTDEDDANPITVGISQRIIHPNYIDGLAYHDIALFKLERNLHFNEWVGPICLHTSLHIYDPKATISGWGQTGFVKRRSSHLMVLDLPIVPEEECERLLGRSTKLPNGVDTETMICAGDKNGGKDACRGDSGGPLMINSSISCLKQQIGIIAFGRMCGLPNTPGIYIRIHPYLSWIQSIVWPE